jgi:hypothetical protein
MSGIGNTLGQAVQGAPKSIMSGEGIFGSLAHAISPVTGGLYDAATAIAGMSLLSGGLSGGGGGGLFGGGSSGGAGSGPALGGGTSDASGFGGMQPAGTLAGMPYYGASDYASYGMGVPANAAFFAPPIPPPPPANLGPVGGGPPVNPISGYLSSGGGGPTTTPIDPNALSNSLNSGGSSLQNSLNSGNFAAGSPAGVDPNKGPWYSNPAYWQGAGSVGSAYLKYLADVAGKQPEFARPFQSSVLNPGFNQIAGVRSSPIAPPQLVV